MTKGFKRAFVLAVTVCMISGLMSVASFVGSAETNTTVATIGDKNYTSLHDAIADANSTPNSVIKVVKDCTMKHEALTAAMTIQGDNKAVVTLEPDSKELSDFDISAPLKARLPLRI